MRLKTPLSLAFVIILCGCSTSPKYTVGDKVFDNPSIATEAVRQSVSESLEGIEPREHFLASSAVIYVPSELASQKGVTTTGNATIDMVKFVATAHYLSYRGMADVLQRRKTFKDLEVREFDQLTPNYNGEAMYIIWLRLESPNVANWYIASKTDPAHPKAVVISPALIAKDRARQWIDGIEDFVTNAPTSK